MPRAGSPNKIRGEPSRLAGTSLPLAIICCVLQTDRMASIRTQPARVIGSRGVSIFSCSRCCAIAVWCTTCRSIAARYPSASPANAATHRLVWLLICCWLLFLLGPDDFRVLCLSGSAKFNCLYKPDGYYRSSMDCSVYYKCVGGATKVCFSLLTCISTRYNKSGCGVPLSVRHVMFWSSGAKNCTVLAMPQERKIVLFWPCLRSEKLYGSGHASGAKNCTVLAMPQERKIIKIIYCF